MQYAIVDADGILQAVVDMPQGQSFGWTGPEDFSVKASMDFAIDPDRDYSDYVWDEEANRFSLTDEALVKDVEVAPEQNPDIQTLIDNAVNAKLEELGLL